MMLLPGMAAAGECISVSTDKAVYAVGESINIELMNQASEPYLLNGFSVMDSDGMIIYSEPVLAFSQYLETGESYDYQWRQNDDSGCQAIAGSYSIIVDNARLSIEISEGQVELSALAETYAIGDEVAFTLVNTGDVAVTVPGGYAVLDESGNIVYAANALAFSMLLQPGDEISQAWAQVTDSGEQAAAGTYRIAIGDNEVTITITSETPELAEEEPQDGGNDTVRGPMKKPMPPTRKSVPMF